MKGNDSEFWIRGFKGGKNIKGDSEVSGIFKYKFDYFIIFFGIVLEF